jgi:hypothetical protein
MFRILLIAFAFPLFPLEVTRVILSADSKPFYKEFWPIVAPLYSAMGFRPTLAFIAPAGESIDATLGDVIRFDPMPDIPESLQAQAIRLLLPALFPEEGCFISDIDMILISRDYIADHAASCPDDAFLIYRDKAEGYLGGKYPMCYVAAKGYVFASVFNVRSKEQIPSILRSWANLGLGWNTDEYALYFFTHEWERYGGRVVRLGHEVTGRLDRANWNLDFDRLDLSRYIDCHCPRPYSAHRASIDRIAAAVRRKK